MNIRSYGEGGIRPVTWEKVWDAIKKIKPGVAKKLSRLEKLCETNQIHYSKKSYEIVAAEKDAVGLCLDIFGDDRRQISALWVPKDDEEPAPFFEVLNRWRTLDLPIMPLGSVSFHAFPHIPPG